MTEVTSRTTVGFRTSADDGDDKKALSVRRYEAKPPENLQLVRYIYIYIIRYGPTSAHRPLVPVGTRRRLIVHDGFSFFPRIFLTNDRDGRERPSFCALVAPETRDNVAAYSFIFAIGQLISRIDCKQDVVEFVEFVSTIRSKRIYLKTRKLPTEHTARVFNDVGFRVAKKRQSTDIIHPRFDYIWR